ncbi:MAG TPA: NAD(P)-dependent oxidoreductase [Burkholderiales bacterium]|nr:NAD(P)-dependent oxidoreductase [Burkholderiales bacterium]
MKKLKPIGQIGLGIMGGAFAKHLLAAKFGVLGFDPDTKARAALKARSGKLATSGAQVANACDVMITSLPSIKACEAAFFGKEGIVSGARRGAVVIEASTMPLEVKHDIRGRCTAHGITVLDCPISGTGAQAAAKDISVYASGDADAVKRCDAVFKGFARSMHYCGEFGNGSKLKFIANLLVTIHNLSAAEAMVMGLKSGLDLDLVYKVIKDGAGTSRMFEVRGPMMIKGDYRAATMKVDVYQKDIDIIGAFAARLNIPVPLFEASKAYYSSALSQGFAKEDTAAVCAVLEQMAGDPRKSSKKAGKKK